MDHYFQMEAYGLTATEPMLEGHTTLGHLAACTSTTRLGLLVTGVTYRHPGLLAQIVTTLDGFAEYAALGIDEAIVDPPDGAPARWIEHRAVAKALAGLG